jgi:predicted RNA-binding Zn ribbon-like protein
MSALLLAENRSDEELLLELLNTTPLVDGVRTDQLEDPSARAWVRERGGDGGPQELTRLREARSALQGLVRGEVSATAVEPFLREVSYRPAASRHGLAWSLETGADDLLAVRSILAWDRLNATGPGRLRPCGNDECALFLIDRSRANTARWCSMAVCGNRMKARRHYQRQRESQG